MTISYEELTSDVNKVMARVAAYIGLNMETIFDALSNMNREYRYENIGEIRGALEKLLGSDWQYDPAANFQNEVEWTRLITTTDEPIVARRGKDDSHLIIAFGGIAKQLLMPPVEFFRISNSLSYNCIFVRDLKQAWYHLGVGKGLNDFGEVFRRLVREIEALAPKTIFATGTSAGGYAALAFGHFLGVDEVHAFVPQTFIDAKNRRQIGEYRWSKEIQRLHRSFYKSAWFFDLAELLKHWNGKTISFVRL